MLTLHVNQIQNREHTMKTGRRVTTPARRGLSLLEVFVVICVLATLAALILPAMQQARIDTRPNYCQIHLKTLVLAATNYAMRNNGHLPQLYSNYSFDPDGSDSAVPDTIRRSWAVSLLPDLDHRGIFRTISAFDADAGAGSGSDFAWPSLKVLQCPQSPGHDGKAGALSYVANAGYIDRSIWHNSVHSKRHHALAYEWDGEAGITEKDLLIAHSTGVFWRPTVPGDHSTLSDATGMSLDFIGSGDGQSNTILFAENLQAGRWDRAENLWEIGFGLKVGLTGLDADFGQDSAHPLRLSGPLKHAADSLPGARPEAKTGTAPRPSSNHGGTCIYGFADGSAKQISDDIDPLVYARLLTPNGQQYGELTDGMDDY